MPNTIEISCPACHNPNIVPWVETDRAKVDGKGYGELGFAARCSFCGFLVTRDSISTRRLVEDLIACLENDNRALALVISVISFLSLYWGRFIPSRGTFFTGHSGFVGYSSAKATAHMLADALGNPHDHLGERLSWSMKTVAHQLAVTSKCSIPQSKWTMIVHLARIHSYSRSRLGLLNFSAPTINPRHSPRIWYIRYQICQLLIVRHSKLPGAPSSRSQYQDKLERLAGGALSVKHRADTKDLLTILSRISQASYQS